MRSAFVGACGLLFGVSMLTAACSDDESDSNGGGSGGSGTDAGSGGRSSGGAASGGAATGGGSSGGAASGGSPGDAGATRTVTGKVIDFTTMNAADNFDDTQYPPLAGVEVCVYANTEVPCVTTSATGEYELTGVPAGDLYLSFEKTGFTPYLYSITAAAPAAIAPPVMVMTTIGFTAQWGTDAGVATDATKGIVLFGATTLGPSTAPISQMFGTTELFYLEGFSATIAPAATDGPVFTSAAWAPDPALTVSSSAGWGFFQTAPGDYTLTITHPTHTCGNVPVKVVAGYATTYVGTLCSPVTEGGAPDGGTPEAGTPDGAAADASDAATD